MLRPRLDHLDVDLVSDRPWPVDVSWAVEVGRQMLVPRRRPLLPWLPRRSSIILRLDPSDDGDFDVAVALAPYSIGGTGLSDRGRVIWSGDDTGTSAAFKLTGSDMETARIRIVSQGGAPDVLVPLR